MTELKPTVIWTCVLEINEHSLNLTTQIRDQIAIIAMKGEIGPNTISPWAEYLKLTLDNDLKAVILDMAEVNDIDDRGFKNFYRNFFILPKEAGVEVAIACVPARLVGFFEISGLDQLFNLYESVEAAMTSLVTIEDNPPRLGIRG